MALYPEWTRAADVRTWMLHYASEVRGPRPPYNPLARLIQSATGVRSTVDPGSVRAEQRAERLRPLLRWRTFCLAIGRPDLARTLDPQIRRLSA